MLPHDPQVRRADDGQPRRGLLRRGTLQGVFPDGNGGALRADHAGGGTAGRPTVLPKGEVQKLVDARQRYGVKVRSAGEAGCPVAAEEVGGGAERFEVTREELIELVEQALRARGASA